MTRIAIVDVEATGLDPTTCHLTEVAVAIYDLELGLVEAFSKLIALPDDEPIPDEVVAITGITAALANQGMDRAAFEDALRATIASRKVTALMAFNSAFDSRWFADLGAPWFCAKDDFDWPKPSKGPLASVALAQGVGVVSAHRALADVMTLVLMLDTVRERTSDLEARVARALVPKRLYQARVSYDDREKVKARGFRWDAARRAWWKSLTEEGAAALVAEGIELVPLEAPAP